MILQRMASAIRRQDWFVVMLEVMIVVVGIFIGLQVDDWNEERKERAQRIIYLERLQDDLTRDLRFLGFVSDIAKERLEEIEYLEKISKTPEIAGDDPELFFKSLVDAGQYRYFTLTPFTFDELKSSGRLNILDNMVLQQDLLRFYGSVSSQTQYTDQMTSIVTEYRKLKGSLLNIQQAKAIDPFKFEGFDFGEWNMTKEEALSVADKYASNQALVSLITPLARAQLSVIRRESLFQNDIEKLLVMIKQDINSLE